MLNSNISRMSPTFNLSSELLRLVQRWQKTTRLRSKTPLRPLQWHVVLYVFPRRIVSETFHVSKVDKVVKSQHKSCQ